MKDNRCPPDPYDEQPRSCSGIGSPCPLFVLLDDIEIGRAGLRDLPSQGFDEFMNVVIDEAAEVYIKEAKPRRELGEPC